MECNTNLKYIDTILNYKKNIFYVYYTLIDGFLESCVYDCCGDCI